MGVRLSAFRAGRPLPTPPQGRFLLLISVRGGVEPRVTVWLEGLGQLKKIHLIGTWTRDLPAHSIAPQPTTLLRAPEFDFLINIRLYSYSHTVSYGFVGKGPTCFKWLVSCRSGATLSLLWPQIGLPHKLSITGMITGSRKPKCSSVTLSTTNPTWSDLRMNPKHCSQHKLSSHKRGLLSTRPKHSQLEKIITCLSLPIFMWTEWPDWMGK
jgi:hypothetical protein